MRLPTATYRLQLRGPTDLAAAARLVPCLERLGISDLYLSPVFTAQPGSSHGYDVTDPNEVEPSLGGRAGLEALARALHDRGMGLILDIVPNHTAFSPANPWLRDVLRHGRASRWAGHFDIDWSAPALRLPWLPAPFEECLAAGMLALGEDADGPVLVAEGGLRVPLAPGSRGPDLRALHRAQPWRLTFWRTEGDAISHRRFFSITGLIGMRVEDERVFDDMHRLVLDLTARGIVDGLRIDHVDGLADPAGYLARLRARLGPGVPVWVEKILTGDEALPDWPVQGTTGYVAGRALTAALTAPGGAARLEAAFAARTGGAGFGPGLAQARREVIGGELAAELCALEALLAPLVAADAVAREYGPVAWRRALSGFLEAFPRYRTYLAGRDRPAADVALLERTARTAAAGLPDPRPLEFLGRLLARPEAAALVTRLQQVTGAVMAKAQEDTLFYRHVPLLSANEVGADPEAPALSAAGFVQAMQQRARAMPHGLTLTSGHDTKRSEDARARIAALSHDPDAFLRYLDACGRVPGAEAAGPRMLWYLAQSLWALPETAPERAARLSDHAVKALREAKETSSWTAPDTRHEAEVAAFARALAADAGLAAPLAPLEDLARRLALVQLGLKLTMPGIPDIYQGCEIGCAALTDPDNRRPVDFAALAAALEAPHRLPPQDRDKLDLTRRLLHLRRRLPGLFLSGDVQPAAATDGVEAGVIAFHRSHGPHRLTVLAAPAPGGGRVAPAGRRLWGSGDLAREGLAIWLEGPEPATDPAEG